MRLVPVPMFCYPDRDRTVYFSGESSRTMHGATECVEASRLFGDMLFRALSGAKKAEIFTEHGLGEITSPVLQAIAQGEYQHKTVTDIRGTGYVVESLEAALWCFWTTETFAQAVLNATNLGDDADTTAAICGQLAGAFYGVEAIPSHWLEKLTMVEEISVLANQLYAVTKRSHTQTMPK